MLEEWERCLEGGKARKAERTRSRAPVLVTHPRLPPDGSLQPSQHGLAISTNAPPHRALLRPNPHLPRRGRSDPNQRQPSPHSPTLLRLLCALSFHLHPSIASRRPPSASSSSSTSEQRPPRGEATFAGDGGRGTVQAEKAERGCESCG